MLFRHDDLFFESGNRNAGPVDTSKGRIDEAHASLPGRPIERVKAFLGIAVVPLPGRSLESSSVKLRGNMLTGRRNLFPVVYVPRQG